MSDNMLNNKKNTNALYSLNPEDDRPVPKAPSESYTEQVHLVNTGDLNGSKRLFGGTLLSWIDMVAGITANRHTGLNATTAAVDNLSFIKPAYAGDLIVLTGKVTYTGNTSLEVCVKSYIEKSDGTRELMNEAYLVMVALDSEGKKRLVPPIAPQTEEEEDELLRGQNRAAARRRGFYKADNKN